MLILKKTVFVLVLVLISTAFLNITVAIADPDQTGLNVNKGKIAPGFTIENLVGEMISLKDFRGNVLILTFGFSKSTALDLEMYRERINTDFNEKGVSFLKVIHINKPVFLTKDFILSKMTKKFETDEPLKLSVIDWGGSLGLDKKYGIKNKDNPITFIIGREGRILFGFPGFFSDENYKILTDELNKILKVGEDSYLGIPTSGNAKAKNSGSNPHKKYKIGVSQIMDHHSFRKAQRGFKSAMEKAGYIQGKNVIYDLQDARANPDALGTIAKKFIKDKVDLVHSLSIMGSAVIVKEIKNIPVVYDIVVDPVGEDIVTTIEPTGNNVTGVAVGFCALQDRWPVDSQFEMYVKILPAAKKWGTVYNPGSVNTMFHIKEMREISEQIGVELVEATASTKEDIAKATRSLIGKVDAFFITSDPIPMSVFPEIAKVCNHHKIPLFGGEVNVVPKGAMAAYNLDYNKAGYHAGEIAARILNGEKPGDIAAKVLKKFHLVISIENASKQGVTFSEEIKKMADTIL